MLPRECGTCVAVGGSLRASRPSCSRVAARLHGRHYPQRCEVRLSCSSGGRGAAGRSVPESPRRFCRRGSYIVQFRIREAAHERGAWRERAGTDGGAGPREAWRRTQARPPPPQLVRVGALGEGRPHRREDRRTPRGRRVFVVSVALCRAHGSTAGRPITGGPTQRRHDASHPRWRWPWLRRGSLSC